MKKRIFLLLFPIFNHSCADNNKQLLPSFTHNYVVNVESKVGDSVIMDHSLSYFVQVDFNDSILKWSKRYFEEDNEGKIWVVDTISIATVLSPNFEITKIRNWNEIYSRMQLESSKFLNNAPETQQEKMKNIIHTISLDSSLIARKHTQDIQAFIIGLEFLQQEKDFSSKEFKVSDEGPYRKLQFNQQSKNPSLTNKMNLLLDSPLPKTKDLNYNIAFETLVNNAANYVKYLSYTISSTDKLNEQHTTTVHISLLD